MSCKVARSLEQEKKNSDDWGREMPNIFVREGVT